MEAMNAPSSIKNENIKPISSLLLNFNLAYIEFYI